MTGAPRIAAGALLAGVAAALLAAFYPGFRSVWTAQGIVAARLIAQHRTAWEVANWSFGVGIVCTLAGVTTLTSLLRPRPYFGLALFTGAAGLWIADLAFRLTTTVDVADQSSRGHDIAGWYGPLWRWGDQGLMEAAGNCSPRLRGRCAWQSPFWELVHLVGGRDFSRARP
jgi:hypothetical protein